MAKLMVIGAIVAMACITICYATNRICNSLDWNSDEHLSLKRDHAGLVEDHATILGVVSEVKSISEDTNRKVSFLCDLVKNRDGVQ